MWQILGRYEDIPETEVIDEFETYDEASRMLSEYKLAYGEGWGLWLNKRRRISA